MTDEATYLAIKTNVPEIINYCLAFATLRKDVITVNLLNYHQQKLDDNPDTEPRQTNLIRSMT